MGHDVWVFPSQVSFLRACYATPFLSSPPHFCDCLNSGDPLSFLLTPRHFLGVWITLMLWVPLSYCGHMANWPQPSSFNKHRKQNKHNFSWPVATTLLFPTTYGFSFSFLVRLWPGSRTLGYHWLEREGGAKARRVTVGAGRVGGVFHYYLPRWRANLSDLRVFTSRGNMEAAAAKLLDFSQPIDVPLLDQVVTTAFNASHPQVRMFIDRPTKQASSNSTGRGRDSTLCRQTYRCPYVGLYPRNGRFRCWTPFIYTSSSTYRVGVGSRCTGT